MSEAPELLLHHHLKKLRLPTFLSDYEKLVFRSKQMIPNRRI